MSFGFPVFLNLEGRRCLVIGSGPMADAKAEALRGAGAVVIRKPGHEAGDLWDCFVAIAATGDREANARIAAEAEIRGVLFNAVDDPDHCNFIFPAVHRDGDLTVAVSTGGKSPVLAARLRDRIAGEIGPEYRLLLDVFGRLREEVAARLPEFDLRRKLWHRLADSDALSLLRAGKPEQAQSLLREIVEEETK